MSGLVLSDDLIFVSRIGATAKAAGLAVRQGGTSAELIVLAAKDPPAGVILDLQNPGIDLPATGRTAKAACPAMPRVTAYGSHVRRNCFRPRSRLRPRVAAK